MLHEVRLPEITRERLTDVVVLQLWLLFYAASKTGLGNADKQACAEKLDNCPRFRGRGHEIIGWIWNAPTKRLGYLNTFASDSTGTQAEKHEWIQQLSREIISLLKEARGSIVPLDKSTATSWQITAAEFFVSFYENILRQSPNPKARVVGFPRYIFSDSRDCQFGAQEFLRAFRNENKANLTICPACDEAPHSINAGNVCTNTGDRKIEADIDHYLPKETYPHLACHPYNLVPNCLTCNQRKKRNKDPLCRRGSDTNSRRHLEEIYQIYREKGLAETTYLKIDFGDSFDAPHIIGLIPKNGCSVRESLSVHQEIYQIPDGWQEPSETQEELLFNNVRNFLDSHDSPFDSPDVIDWLDAYLSEILRECGRKAYTILRTWLLVSHINEAASIFDASGNKIGNTAFLKELELQCEIQDPTFSIQLLSKQSIRNRIQQARTWREAQVI